MCGLVGFYPSIEKNRNLSFLEKMLAPIKHRGPDKKTIFQNNKIALGHHRLSIIDLQGGMQPKVDKNNFLVFNGEIYGYKKNADFLKKKGISLADNSDTEVLFNYIKYFGIDFTLSKLDGMYAFVYYNEKINNLYLVRDKSGEKPLYYSLCKDHLIFSSEIKSILSCPLYNGDLDLLSVNYYLNLDYIPLDQTLFKNIKKVLPGQMVEFDGENKSFVKKKFWSLNYTNANEKNMEISVNKLDSLLTESVQERLIADVPVGLFLSGGIDSSLIAFYAKKISSQISSFTIKFKNDSYDESSYSKQIADHLKIKNYCYEFEDREIIDALSCIEKKLDTPISDPSLLPTYMISKFAKQKVKVALSGDGADELFNGYAPFKYVFILRLLYLLPKVLGEASYNILKNVYQNDNYMSILFLLKSISKGLGYKPNQQIFRWMSSFTNQDIKNLFKAELNMLTKNNGDIFKFLSLKYDDKNLQDQISRMFFDFYLANNILTKVDLSSMYNSLEVRSPFLSSKILDFSSDLHFSLKSKFNTKKILKKLCEGKIPKNIIERKKHGFAVPLASFLRTSLKEKVSGSLLSTSSHISSFIDNKNTTKILADHYKGIDNRKQIWSLYILEKTLKNCLG